MRDLAVFFRDMADRIDMAKIPRNADPFRTNKKYTDSEGKVIYSLYMKSERWSRVRQAALARADHRCQICNCRATTGNPLNAHHRTYIRLGHERPGDITIICQLCHDIFHKYGRVKS